MVETILELMPSHRTYVEAFGGAAAVLLAKEPATVEIYNDIDRKLYDFFNFLKNPEKAAVLRHHLELTPFSRDVYLEYVQRFDSIDDEIERAVAFVVIANQSFNGKFAAGWKVSRLRNVAKPYFRALRYIETAARRLRNAHIENKDFEYVLQKYDSPETVFYLDPTYFPDTRRTKKAYRHEMFVLDHLRLLHAVKSVSGMVLLSGYPHRVYDDWLDGWQRETKDVYCLAGVSQRSESTDTEANRRTEVVWLNPRAVEALRAEGTWQRTRG